MSSEKTHGQAQGEPPAPCRILLVEDDLDDRAFSKRRLEGSDEVAEVKCFSGGQELMDYMREQGFYDHTVMCMTPTIIVLDLNMPRMDGFRVLSQLKSDTFLEEIPVVVVSGELSFETFTKAREMRADGVLRKPLSVEKLRSFLSHGWQWPTRDMWMS